MTQAADIAATFAELGISHVVWLPDSMLGTWEKALESHPQFSLVRVCREGEAWVTAAGLLLGGKRPLVVIQCTGLFESGDALRNVVHDMKLPVYGIIGYRGYLISGSTDSARHFTEPVVRAWQIDHVLLDAEDPLPRFAAHYQQCQAAGQPGLALWPEGRG